VALTAEQRDRLRAFAGALAGTEETVPDARPAPGAALPPGVGAGVAASGSAPDATTQQALAAAEADQDGRTPGPAPAAGGTNARLRAVLRAVGRHVAHWDARIGDNVPTPGGLGWLVFALVFLIVAIVPFNGYTRLQWLWMALTGAATLPSSAPGPTPAQQAAAAGVVGQGIAAGASVAAGLPASTVPAPVASAFGQGLATGIQATSGFNLPRAVLGS
jgi:hypothetical protein